MDQDQREENMAGSPNEIVLRYGANPHQKSAKAYMDKGDLPISVLNGSPGYINLLDALNAWQLVRELKTATGLPAAASFKHVSPAGAAVANPLSENLRKAYLVGDKDLTPLAAAYARARGGDRMSSYGDFAALSDKVDESTALLLKPEVSDGVIAPDYDKEALDILMSKKGGKYLVLQIDSDYRPPKTEKRQVFGVWLEQMSNDGTIDKNLLKNIVTDKRDIPPDATRDLLVATVALKYTQSNSVAVAYDGQLIGAGAGQQSRIHCTRLACAKADKWLLQMHPRVLSLDFADGLKRPDKMNAVDQFLLWDELSDFERKNLAGRFKSAPEPLSLDERRDWLAGFTGLSLSSDGFIPFRDNIDRASRSGIGYVLQPGGSIADDEVIKAANDYGMVMAFSNLRLFHH
jgi:phosphoribosylaminoimidazolecarboxamide formyltransferase/IMP cyclohydrolase